MAGSYAELQRQIATDARAKADSMAGWRTGFSEAHAATSLEQKAERAEEEEYARERAAKQTAQAGADWNLKQAQEAWDLQKKQADASGKTAAQFLESWGSSLSQISSMYGDSATVLKGLMTGGGETEGTKGLGELSKLMQGEYTSFREQYAPMEKEAMFTGREMTQQKAAIQREIAKGGGTWADTEGAAARAKTDVGIQGELQNQIEARKLMSMGVDPSSGRFGALTRKGAIDTAGETVKAMNLARQTEKTQGLGRAIAASGAINPSEYTNIGTGIRKSGTDILQGAGALETARAGAETSNLNAKTNLGSAYTNMTSSMAQNITNPLAEMAGYFTGMSGGNVGAIKMPKTMNLQSTSNVLQ